MRRAVGGTMRVESGRASGSARLVGRRALGSFLAGVLLLWSGPGVLRGAEEVFEQANKLYESGRFQEAAAAYQSIIDREGASSTLYFNMGNAHFKAGHVGAAIAAYRSGLQLDPRDPSLRFNLQFAREQVSGEDVPPESLWRRALTGLTLNEWTVLFSLAYWIWLVMLCLREARPEWRRAMSGYAGTAGVLTLGLGACLGGAAYHRYGTETAVVVVQETVVRYGPLEESQVHYQLRDGSEVTVLDRKQGETTWLQVRDDASREGWLKADDVKIPGPPTSHSKK